MAKPIIASLALFLFVSSVANAQTTHTVGGNSGWNTGVNYATWATGRTFATGDSLLFNYGGTHDVAEVNQDDYDNCGTGNLISVDSSSPTRITLSGSGTRYFICSLSNHCSRGMKLAVTVATGSTTPSPPSGGAAPSPPASTTPSPPSSTTPLPPSTTTPFTPNSGATPDATVSPPPPNVGAASNLGGRSHLMVGLLSVILAAVFGFMG